MDRLYPASLIILPPVVAAALFVLAPASRAAWIGLERLVALVLKATL